MDWTPVLTFLASLGGAGAVAAGVTKWLGSIYAKRLTETLKAELARRNDILRSDRERLQKLWSALSDLRDAGDELWEVADQTRLIAFSGRLSEAEKELRRNAPFLERTHVEGLEGVLRAFGHFKFGKEKLVELRAIRTLANVSEHEIERTIKDNGRILEEYGRLVSAVCDSIREHVRA